MVIVGYQVVKSDETKIDVIEDKEEGVDVSPINNEAGGLFQDMESTVPGTNVTLGVPNGTHPFKSYTDQIVLGRHEEDLGKLYMRDDCNAIGTNSYG